MLPAGSPDLVELWHFYCRQLGLKPEQAVWVSTATGDGSLDEVASKDCAVVEASRLTRSLIAYADHPQLRELARKHGLMMPCDSDSWRLERGHKVIT